MTRTGREAIAWARDHMTWKQGYCLQWVRSCYGVGPRDRDAGEGWRDAKHKHRTRKGEHCPRGVPVWWTDGGDGHVALSVGNGFCLSTDAWVAGTVAKVRIDDITSRWSKTFEGWTEDINGVRVYDAKAGKPAAGWERVRLSALGPGKRNKDVEVVKRRLVVKFGDRFDLATGEKWGDYWGERMTKAYRAWQERLGFEGADADGRPGRVSLERLGLTVV